MPTGPGMLVLPGTGKSFDQFRADDLLCRRYAQDQVAGLSPDRASSDSGLRSAAAGAAVGALAGAAINGGHGASVGAGTGLLVGSVAGAGAAQSAGDVAQQRYDVGYTQCMYAQGHRVPVSGRFTSQRPPAGRIPPPPAGLPPAPPPGAPG